MNVTRMVHLVAGLLAAAAIVTACGIVGRMDYQDAVLQDEAYCANVHSGLWPDYESRYKRDCKTANESKNSCCSVG